MGVGVSQHWVWQDAHSTGRGRSLAEALQVRCIHGDLHEYSTVLMWLHVAGCCFWCTVGAVPQLYCPVLLGRDCPVLTYYLWIHMLKTVEAKAVQARDLLLRCTPCIICKSGKRNIQPLHSFGVAQSCIIQRREANIKGPFSWWEKNCSISGIEKQPGRLQLLISLHVRCVVLWLAHDIALMSNYE